MKKNYAKLNPWAAALTCGIVWGAAVFLMAMIASLTGFWTSFVNAIGSVYFGTAPGLKGGLIGLLWAFTDGFFGGAILVLVYNYFLDKFKK